ncbi:MAG: hypothetical protein JO279_00740 [Verrucomicrobia bacterium]|nr:hypothetical protein [Verrucomicrobiota bacterium]
MPLNTKYLKELSDLFVEDLKRSDYYRALSKKERNDLDDRLAADASAGLFPLLPGAEEAELQKLSHAICEKLNIELPAALVDILRQVDGFSENGVSLCGVDAELRDDQFDSGPGLLAENLVNWSSFPETLQKYLFVGDSDLWHFAIELDTGVPVALHKATLKQAHRFSTIEELVNDMMQQALGDFGDEIENLKDEAGNRSPGFQFSSN